MLEDDDPTAKSAVMPLALLIRLPALPVSMNPRQDCGCDTSKALSRRLHRGGGILSDIRSLPLRNS
jgi:hypothetical protein